MHCRTSLTDREDANSAWKLSKNLTKRNKNSLVIVIIFENQDVKPQTNEKDKEQDDHVL